MFKSTKHVRMIATKLKPDLSKNQTSQSQIFDKLLYKLQHGEIKFKMLGIYSKTNENQWPLM